MPHPSVTVAVRHPLTGRMEALNPAVDYPDDDAFVLTYPWAFEPIEDAGRIVESVSVESATANPGEKRSRKR